MKRDLARELAFDAGLLLCTIGISLWSVAAALVFVGAVLCTLVVVGKRSEL